MTPGPTEVDPPSTPPPDMPDAKEHGVAMAPEAGSQEGERPQTGAEPSGQVKTDPSERDRTQDPEERPTLEVSEAMERIRAARAAGFEINAEGVFRLRKRLPFDLGTPRRGRVARHPTLCPRCKEILLVR